MALKNEKHLEGSQTDGRDKLSTQIYYLGLNVEGLHLCQG